MSYSISPEYVKAIHEEKMDCIKKYTENIVQLIEENAIPYNQPLALLIDEHSNQKDLAAYKKLGILMSWLSSCFMDIYILHRVLAISAEFKVVVIPGGEHSACVQGEIVGALDNDSLRRNVIMVNMGAAYSTRRRRYISPSYCRTD